MQRSSKPIPLEEFLSKMLRDLDPRTAEKSDADTDGDCPIHGKPQGELSEEAQLEKLKLFFQGNNPVLNVGDRVVRNSFGEEQYTMPKSGQVALVSAKYASPIVTANDGESTYNGEIALVVCGNVRTFQVDLRRYRKVSA